MEYEINKKLWHTCQICQQKIKNLAKQYGGKNIYYTDVFKKHIEIDHNITLNEYFIKYDNKHPECKCGICHQKCTISKKGSNIRWIPYVCGRYEGTLKWSEKAKTSRCGSKNPMYGKLAWNSGLTKDTNNSVLQISLKMTNRTVTELTKKKQSISAKNRPIHGHLGHKHSEETKEKLRQNTLRLIKSGCYRQTRSKPHIILSELLNKENILYIEEYNVKCWSFDFFLPDYSIYIEVDGDYFHSHPKLYPNGPKTKTQKINWYRDIKKNKFCEENHLNLIRFWESDILNKPEEIICILKKLLV